MMMVTKMMMLVVVMMMVCSCQTRFGIVLDLNKLVVALCWEAGGKTDELTPVHNQGNHICSNVLSVDKMDDDADDDDDGDDDYSSKRRTIAKHALLVQKGRLKSSGPTYFSKS